MNQSYTNASRKMGDASGAVNVTKGDDKAKQRAEFARAGYKRRGKIAENFQKGYDKQCSVFPCVNNIN